MCTSATAPPSVRCAIVPAAVGVDIGCGMMAQMTTLTAADLPDSLNRLRLRIEAAVPHGGVGLKGGWKNGAPNRVVKLFARSGLGDGLRALEDKHPAIRDAHSLTHLGSLGGGNHSIEICLDGGTGFGPCCIRARAVLATASAATSS